MTRFISPKAILVFSAVDRGNAHAIVSAVRNSSKLNSYDMWELSPEESLQERIFTYGIQDCVAFIVFFSRSSQNNKWSLEMLGSLGEQVAAITTTVAIISSDCTMADIGSHFKIVNMTQGLSIAATALSHHLTTAFRLKKGSVHPNRANLPDLGDEASLIARFLMERVGSGDPGRIAFGGIAISRYLEMTPEEINIGVEELETKGYVKVVRALGTSPYSFQAVMATFTLLRVTSQYSEEPYDSDEDIRNILEVLLDQKRIDGNDLVDRLKISPVRANAAIEYLSDYAVVETIRAIGTAPFNFAFVRATDATTVFAEKCLKKRS